MLSLYFQNKNVVDDLEKQLAALTLNENVPKLAPIETAQEKGSIKVGTETRKVVTGSRKTKEGALSKQQEAAKERKEKALFLATLKKKRECNADDDDASGEEWEDVEEDFPHVKLEELMENLKIDDFEEISDED